MRRSEGHFRGSDQLDLFYQSWQSPTARGTLVITHGMSEHSDCYNLFSERLDSSDWNIFACDLRGHGRSEGKRGVVRSFNDYVLDLLSFLEHLRRHHQIEKGPVVLLGHSMGGLVTLRAAVTHKLNVQALVLSSPLLGIAVRVPPIKDWASRILAKYLPELTLQNELHYEYLSRDPDMVKSYEHDPLRHEKVSAPLYLGMLESIQLVHEKRDQLQIPVLFQLAGADRVVSTPIAKAFFESLKITDKTLHIYPESYHEIYNDLDYKEAVTDLNQFLNRFLVKS